MWDLLERLFGEGFMPHGHCYLWSPAMVWLQVVSNAAVGLAYVSISLTLYYIVRRIKDVPFSRMYLAFGVFIVTCGMTHFLDVVTVWHPVYWLDGGVRAVTAVASVGTAILLLPLVPKAVALAGAARVVHERGLELEKAYADLAVAHEKTKELENAKTQFFANASHELRTPLTLILGPVDRTLADPSLSEEHRRSLDLVKRNARVLLTHVNDLLDVSKIEAGRVAPRYARADLAHVTRLVGSLFESAAREKNVAFYVEAPPVLPAEMDPDMIERVLRNLLSNALKHVSPAGTVRCQVERVGDRARLTVDDDGPGVPPAARGLVFQRYRQAEAAGSAKPQGTGLGLAIAKDLVELHGGAISIGDAPGGGARFRVDVPIVAPKGVRVLDRPARATPTPLPFEIELQPAAPSAPEPTSGADGRPLVLIVEDNHDMRRFVRDTLSNAYRIESAADGVEGLAKARALAPDAIVTDVMMPRKGGEDLVRELRAEAVTREVPVLVLSARADDAGRIRLLEAGAQDYVVKPFAAAELLARLKGLVETKRARDVLRRELESTQSDVSTLAAELGARARDLAKALQDAREARERAEQSSAIKANLLNLVSHELRTPIASMQIQLELLRRAAGAGLSPRAAQGMSTLHAMFGRHSHAIRNLLEYADLASGGQAAEATELDVSEQIAKAFDEVTEQASERGVRLRSEVSPGLPPLRTDPHLLGILVEQLTRNAARFARDGGEVVVRVTADGDRHLLSVSDDGEGLSEDARRSLFEPFWQNEGILHKHAEGMGLGLALCRKVAETLGARIEVTSEAGKGATFTVFFEERIGQADA